MTQDHVNLLTLKEFYMILSEKTQRPYLDINYACYLFDTKSEADVFAKSLDKCTVKNSQYYRAKILCTDLLTFGIKSIKIKEKGNDSFVDIPINTKDGKNIYYNEACNRYLLRLKQTSQKKYLFKLKDVNFLAPILIDIRKKASYPGLHYSYAYLNDDASYFLLFSTLKEFEEWQNSQLLNWKPMELNLKKFGRIRGSSPVLINPLSDKMILTSKQINQILD